MNESTSRVTIVTRDSKNTIYEGLIITDDDKGIELGSIVVHEKCNHCNQYRTVNFLDRLHFESHNIKSVSHHS